MADDINAGRRTELKAQLSTIEPQIRGLDDLAKTSVSPDLIAALTEESNTLKRRHSLIQAELDGMDQVNTLHAALVSDGYPDLPPATASQSLIAELKEEQSDLLAAISIFQAEAAIATVDLGPPLPKQ